MEALQFEYYYGSEAEQFRFLMVPKAILEESQFSVLSCEAILLYSYMLDRMSLSRSNGWMDGEKRVYIIFEVKDICGKLRCGEKKATKILKELSDIGLIQTKRQGLGRPNLYFVMNFVSVVSDIKPPASGDPTPTTPEAQKERPQNRQNDVFRKVKTAIQEPSETPCNNINIINTDFNHTDSSLSIQPDNGFGMESRAIHDIDRLRELVKENLEYDVLLERVRKDRLNEAVELIVNVLACQEESYQIGKRIVPMELVKSRYLSLTCEHIEYAFERMDSTASKIGNIQKYLETVLFNAPLTMQSYYQAQVSHDMKYPKQEKRNTSYDLEEIERELMNFTPKL